MNRLFRTWLALAALLPSAWGADTVPGALAENQLRAAETPAQFNQRMAWWREARFGLFIHWGLYAIPAGVWKGQDVKICATGSRLFFNIPTAEWDPLIQQFDPPWYQPRDWAKMAKAAGMKYAVLTTKHHEGFCLFDSKLSNFTAMQSPAHRDLVREWLDAFRAEGIRVGFYYSLIDWHHPDYPVVGDQLHPERARPEALAEKRDLNKYLDYLHGQVRELMSNYGKIDILWFDYSYGKMTGEAWRAAELMKMIRSLQPEIIVNNRLEIMVGNQLGPIGDFATPEQAIPPNGIPGVDWETCMTMNDTWGYKSRDHNWKSTATLIRNLADITSKGGNYLLNVGPTAEGVIPEASVNRLTEIGRWMQRNGESIAGTAASPFPRQLPWGRCTMKPLPDGTTRLYLHVFEWPGDGKLILPGLKNPVSKAHLLADPQCAPLAVSRESDSVVIQLPAAAPDPSDTVVVAEIAGSPEVSAAAFVLRPALDGTVLLRARDADIHGRTAYYSDLPGHDSIGYWIDLKDSVSWDFAVKDSGKFVVEITYGCAPDSGGGEYEVEVDRQKLPAKARATESWFARTTDKVGVVKLAAGDKHTLAIRLKSKPGLAVMDLQGVTLKPMKD